MDLTSVIGIVLGLSAVIVGNLLEGSHMSSITQPTAAIIVFGGTFGAVSLGFPGKHLRLALAGFIEIFKGETRSGTALIPELVALAYKARRDGIIALEENAQKAEDPFMKKALVLLSDGSDSKHLRETLEIELTTMEGEKEAGAKVLEYAGGVAPTIGILGAVLGLIHVMQNLTDPSKLGSGIAVAFVATVYGVGSANLIFIPASQKIRARAKALVAYYEMLLEGVLAVQNGDNPRSIEDKLKGFLSESEKKSYVSAEQKSGAGSAAKAAT